uniref:Protein FAR1-RELATED SEQUENCE n=1 Tax=Oryza sativa subsp. japonica TaxID=39947 RepID=Q6Z0Z8_ORYSJ|nr:hypothetical protein [Oryza sativa Japonica Group]BAD33263.1 hypothetical protein [Oryza sativa Japonica Group]
MARRLEFDDVHSDAESVTTECDDSVVPHIGMTFTDVESAKEFYECYAHRVGFSIRIGQHKKVDGVVLYKCFLCANNSLLRFGIGHDGHPLSVLDLAMELYHCEKVFLNISNMVREKVYL